MVDKENPFCQLWILSLSLSIIILFLVLKQTINNNFKSSQYFTTSEKNIWIIKQPEDYIHNPSDLVLNKEENEFDKLETKNKNFLIKKDLLKEAYLSWMSSVSNENKLILEMIYDEVSKYPNKNLLLAIIYNETWPKFNPWSYSKIGAMCLMQVNPHVWTEKLIKKGIIKKKSDLWRIDKCIEAGNYIINYYLKKYHGDLKKALNDYVGGSEKYVENVISDLRKIDKLITKKGGILWKENYSIKKTLF